LSSGAGKLPEPEERVNRAAAVRLKPLSVDPFTSYTSPSPEKPDPERIRRGMNDRVEA